MSVSEYYDSTGVPSTGSSLSSATIRAEFDAVQNGISAKLPDLSGKASLPVFVNSGASALETKTASAALIALGGENTTNKDSINGYVGMTVYDINFTNSAGTFVSLMTNSNTAARTYTFQDRSGTIADDTDLALKADVTALHAESHTVASHSDTTATGAELETLTDNSMADALHRHSELSASDGTPDPALSVGTEGVVTISYALTQVGAATLQSTATFQGAATFQSTAGFTLGTTINEFSTDGTLAGDSDDAVPTEKAVKLYVDSNIGGDPVVSLGPCPSGTDKLGDITGGMFSPNATDAANYTDFGKIFCMDSTNSAVIESTSTMTKRLDAVWAAGTGNGGLLNGTKAANTLYLHYVLLKDSDQSVDYGSLAYSDAIATYAPSGYSKWRFIGAVRTDASSNIIPYQFDEITAEMFFTKASTTALNSATAVPADCSTAIDISSWVGGTDIVAAVMLGAGSSGATGCVVCTGFDGTNVFSTNFASSTNAGDTDAAAWGSHLYGNQKFMPLKTTNIYWGDGTYTSANTGWVTLQGIRFKR